MGGRNGGWAGASTQVKLVPGKFPETKKPSGSEPGREVQRFEAARNVHVKFCLERYFPCLGVSSKPGPSHLPAATVIFLLENEQRPTEGAVALKHHLDSVFRHAPQSF
jgi:hypothetical protein